MAFFRVFFLFYLVWISGHSINLSEFTEVQKKKKKTQPNPQSLYYIQIIFESMNTPLSDMPQHFYSLQTYTQKTS